MQNLYFVAMMAPDKFLQWLLTQPCDLITLERLGSLTPNVA